MGWCPYDSEECHHDGYCDDCPHNKEKGNNYIQKTKPVRTKLFLNLDDATDIVCDLLNNWGTMDHELTDEDREYIRSELEQKSYISDEQYSIGFLDAFEEMKKYITHVENGGDSSV